MSEKSFSYREFDEDINTTLKCSDELLSAISELISLYRPKTQDEASDFYCVKYKLPDVASMICTLRETPDIDDSDDSIAPLKDYALDILNHMACASVLVNDIINMVVEPHDSEFRIFSYLSVLESISDSIRFLRRELEELYNKTSSQWLERVEQEDGSNDDYEDEEESTLPGEIESFQVLKRILIRALAEYTVKNESERINGFFIAVQEYLSDFSNGIEPQKEFSFGFSRRTGDDEQNELEYVDFSFESEMLEVSSGGHVYDKSVGGDTYSKWTYSIWLNGEVDESYYNYNEIFYLVNAGAELNIELPEEFIDYDEEDD